MNKIQVFQHEQFGNIRVVELNSEFWFVGKDIAQALGYENPRDALRRHVTKTDRAGVVIRDMSQRRMMTAINESGLYSLILGSKLPSAQAFKHWVIAEVLSSIHGKLTPSQSELEQSFYRNKTLDNSKNTFEDKEVKFFQHKQFGKIRVVELNGESWFVGKDIAQALGYENPREAFRQRVALSDKDAVTIPDGIGRAQTTTILNESGLYSLILGSKLPSAQAFKHWVTSEVLPSIRKHGIYMTYEKMEEILTDPSSLVTIAKAFQDERIQKEAALKKAEQLQLRIDADRAKVLFADSVAASQSCILIRELAKLLSQNGVLIGQNRLFERLRQDEFLIRQKGTDYNTPTQKSIKMGLFQLTETAVTHSDGHITISKTTKVTGKGQQYFIKYFLKHPESDEVPEEITIINSHPAIQA